MQLARPWTLPLTIASGLAAAYAIPWNFQGNTGYVIFTTLVPLLTHASLSAVTTVMAFLGKSSWLTLQISTTVIAFVNSIGFSFGIWGVNLPNTPVALLWLSTLPLITIFIWGRKEISSNPRTDYTQPSADQGEW